jgi:hypothetical protein
MLSHKYKGVTLANLSLYMLEVRVNASYEQDHMHDLMDQIKN